jgi:gliding motility-associated-like protein
MTILFTPTKPARVVRSFALLYLLLAFSGLARAQTPPWELATSGSPNQSGTALTYATAVDAHGNVFVTGQFSSTVVFGKTVLTSQGGTDIFVAKWDATAQAFTWATSGGSKGDDRGRGIAVSGTGIFVTGYFNGDNKATIAGQELYGAGIYDVFVAKYVDTSTGSTPATSSVANGWATSGGGSDQDEGTAIAVNGTSIYVTGYFGSGHNMYIAGNSLPGTGRNTSDMFVAKYVDTSTGSTPATSSFANGWATSGGGTRDDWGSDIAVNGTSVLVIGDFTSNTDPIPISIAGQALTGAGYLDVFVAKYVDTSTGSTPATSSFANGWATSGGGTSDDWGEGIAVNGTSVFVTGSFNSGHNTLLAGQTLTGKGQDDVFLAKYIDTSTGSTPATSSVANGWAISAGGKGDEQGNSLVVRGTSVFVTGYFSSGTPASIAGQNLSGAGGYDVFVAKYMDTSTGSTPANGWATSAGGTGDDAGLDIALSGQQVFVVGKATPPATFGSLSIGTPVLSSTDFLARLTDPTGLVTPPGSPAPPVSFGVAHTPECVGEISTFTAVLSPAITSATVSWDFGEPVGGATNTAVGLTAQHQYAQAGTYQVTMRVTTVNGQVYNYLQPVLILARQVTQLRASTPACVGQPVTISVEPTPPPGTRYTWQDGSSSTTPMLTVNASGVYWVDISSPQLCPQRDSIRLLLAAPPQIDLGLDRPIGCGEVITLNATSRIAGSSYRWQDGSTQAQYTAIRPGRYTVAITTPSGCTAQGTVNLQATADCEVLLPNIITPDNDNLNDKLVVRGLAAGSFAIVIYNRWGQEVYQQATYLNNWDATGNTDGIYYYLVTANTGQRYKGWVEVLHKGK